MMNKNQEITFQLLKEIDEICKKVNIKYYLHADTAAMALIEGHYIGNYLSSAVEMTTQDARKFIQYIEQNPKENRVLEHMGNYEGYAGFNMKYINTDTTYIPINYYDNYKNKGIGIHIFFIRRLSENKWKQKLWTALEYGLEQNEFFFSRKPGKREVIGKILTKFLQIFWKKKKMKKYFFDKWLQEYDYLGEGKAVVRKAYGKSHTYPSNYFEEEKMIEFEGYKFPIVWDVEEYIRSWKGKGWKDTFKGLAPGRDLIVEADINFKEYVALLDKEGIDLEAVKQSHKIVKKELLKRSVLNKEKNEYWQYAWNVRKNFISDKKYKEARDYIKTLYNNDSYMELSRKYSYYDKVMKENLKYGYSRIGEEEIHLLYKEILEVKSNTQLLEKISKLEN